MWLSWQDATLIACVLAVGGVAAGRRAVGRLAGAGAFAREAAVIVGLYGIWQYAGSLAITKVDGARAHALSLWHAERVLHLPSEAHVQHLVLPHHLVVEFSNVYYAVVHGPALIAFLVWMFVRHRDGYPRVRNTIALVTGACLLIQMIPVAPPRMFPGLGFVDTALVYKQSVYRALGSGFADELSAMPSVHVAWAVLIALFMLRHARSAWRWVGPVHAGITIVVVVVTANHFWLDGGVAVALIVPALGIQWSGERLAALLAGYRAREVEVATAA